MLSLVAVDGGAEAALAGYRAKVAATIRCRAPEGDEIAVCARRDADRYRVPLKVMPDPGDPKHEGVHDERERLQAKRNNCAEKSAFLVGCGHVGVTVSTRTGFRLIGEERELAP